MNKFICLFIISLCFAVAGYCAERPEPPGFPIDNGTVTVPAALVVEGSITTGGTLSKFIFKFGQQINGSVEDVIAFIGSLTDIAFDLGNASGPEIYSAQTDNVTIRDDLAIKSTMPILRYIDTDQPSNTYTRVDSGGLSHKIDEGDEIAFSGFTVYIDGRKVLEYLNDNTFGGWYVHGLSGLNSCKFNVDDDDTCEGGWTEVAENNSIAYCMKCAAN